MRIHSINGGDGLALHVRDIGPLDAPAILFIHGWSQHHLCWYRQLESTLSDRYRLVALDLRGHGQSEAPPEAEAYTDGGLWAADIDAVIKTLELNSPTLVAWSYGGLVVGDYLRIHGDDLIAGVNLVCAAVGIGPSWFGNLIGQDFVDYATPACSEDQAVALRAIHSLAQRFFGREPDANELGLAIGWSMLTTPQVRANISARDVDFTPEFADLRKPLLVTFGAIDAIVLPAMAKLVAEHVPSCKVSEYADSGHAPFLEDAKRYNSELAEFILECVGSG